MVEIGHGLRADIPLGWKFSVIQGKAIELEPPSRVGAVHISVVRPRSPERDPSAEDARSLLRRVPVWRNRMSSSEIVVSQRGDDVVALADAVGPEGHFWDVGVVHGRRRAAVFTFNSGVARSPEREEARRIFDSIEGLDS